MGTPKTNDSFEGAIEQGLESYRKMERYRYAAHNFLRFGDNADLDKLIEEAREEAGGKKSNSTDEEPGTDPEQNPNGPEERPDNPEKKPDGPGERPDGAGQSPDGPGEKPEDTDRGPDGVGTDHGDAEADPDDDRNPGDIDHGSDGPEKGEKPANKSHLLDVQIPPASCDEYFDIPGSIALLDIFGTPAYNIGIVDVCKNPDTEATPLPPGTHQCDFCARPLLGEYEKLRDGRERCGICSRTVVQSAKEAENLFREVKRKMEISFGIDFDNPISATIVDARKLYKRMGETWSPKPGYDPRTVGFVVNKPGHQEMWLENGAPRNALMSTIAHELTHVWQHQNTYFLNLPTSVVHDTYLLIVEGQATWTEVQFLKLVGEFDDADAKMEEYHRRDDEYGKGFRLYESRYGFSDGSIISKDTPFNHPDGPLKS